MSVMAFTKIQQRSFQWLRVAHVAHYEGLPFSSRRTPDRRAEFFDSGRRSPPVRTSDADDVIGFLLATNLPSRKHRGVRRAERSGGINMRRCLPVALIVAVTL